MPRARGLVHVMTAHYKSARWIDIQLEQIRRHISSPLKLWGSLEGVGTEHHPKFDRVVEAVGRHEGKLNLMAAEALNEAHPDDLFVFLDGDAFPVADPIPRCTELLEGSSLVAVRRDENLGDPQPHPCFAVTYAGTWSELRGDWSTGHSWTNSRGRKVTDVGGNLLRILELSGRRWEPLARTRSLTGHDVWFGIYGGLVYHHGAGFKQAISRVDDMAVPFSKSWPRGDLVRRKLHKGFRSGKAWMGARRSEEVYRWVTRNRRALEELSASTGASLPQAKHGGL